MVAIKPTRDFTNNARTSFTTTNKKSKGSAALTVEQFKENQCKSMGISIGPRHHEECPFGVTATEYASTGNNALETTISSAYKQVFGNANPTDSQRCKELESQLRDGRITTRDFVAGLAKSEFYKQNYYHKVSPIKGVEHNFKHLLGRPPINQSEISSCIKLIADQGYDILINKMTSSGEYLEVFGTNTVPYDRAWKSEAGFYCSTFVNMCTVSTGNASSDKIVGGRSQLVMALAQARELSTSTGNFDVSGFSYSRAVQDPSSGAFKRMFMPQTTKRN
ncbi:MAG: phycobilisome rod-core linker polypeptide [Synechococcus sp. ArSW.bin.68]|jgi:phycocyanin-associated rod linker protein